jgi:hypothetical protein
LWIADLEGHREESMEQRVGTESWNRELEQRVGGWRSGPAGLEVGGNIKVVRSQNSVVSRKDVCAF